MRTGLLLPSLVIWSLSSGSSPLRAQPITDIILPDVSGEVGERVATDLVLQNAPGITGITLEIQFDPALVAPDPEISMGSWGASLNNIHGANIVGTDLLRVAVAVFTDTVGYTGSGVLLTIEWDLLAPGTSPLEFVSTLLENNQSPPALPGFPIDGSIEVEGTVPPPPGGCDCPANEPRVLLSSAQGQLGDQVTFDIGVQLLPVPLDAFGLTLVYDPTVLDFVEESQHCIDLAGDWAFCDAAESTPGFITIGGFHTSAIPAGSTGGLVRISFDVVCAACAEGDESQLELTELQDDLAELSTCCGLFTYGEGCPADGDVNRNGSLSPGDAQCAFKMYFNNQMVTDDCDVAGNCEVAAADVNCDGTVTPGDALAIFRRWLENEEPAHCFGQGGAMSRAAEPTRRLAVTGADIESPTDPAMPFALDTAAFRSAPPGTVALPIVMQALEGSLALALRLDYEPDELDFVRLELAPPARNWQALVGREVEAGHLLVGGFDPRGLAPEFIVDQGLSSGRLVIGRLIFRKLSAQARFKTIRWIEQILAAAPAGDTTPAAPDRVLLGSPRPNPTREGITFRLTIPDHHAARFEVAIYDVQGRRLRTVLDAPLLAGEHDISWDRMDEDGRRAGAGIYFIRAAGTGLLETRKLVILN